MRNGDLTPVILNLCTTCRWVFICTAWHGTSGNPWTGCWVLYTRVMTVYLENHKQHTSTCVVYAEFVWPYMYWRLGFMCFKLTWDQVTFHASALWCGTRGVFHVGVQRLALAMETLRVSETSRSFYPVMQCHIPEQRISPPRLCGNPKPASQIHRFKPSDTFWMCKSFERFPAKCNKMCKIVCWPN
jgi:hypothetical protein